MIFQNPWAWLGLVAMAVPILAHLLARRRARRLAFPTLRFLDASRLMLARRDRLTDLLLLAVRCGVLAAAAAALAQPWWITARRARDLGRSVARAVIVDASASMQRATPTGGTALAAAEREGRRLAADAAAGTVQLSAEPARALPGAVAWLTTQPGRRELVVVSDFQAGAIDARDLAAVPAGMGVQPVRIEVIPSPSAIDATSTAGRIETTAHITFSPARTDVTWTTRPRDAGPAGEQPVLLAGAAERAAADAAADAAHALGAPPLAADRPVAVVFPGFERRDALLKQSVPLTDPWMFDAVARLRHDPALAEAAAVAGDADGGPLFAAARGPVDGRERLLLFLRADAGSLASATLLARLPDATSPAAPVAELDPSTVADDVLRGWQRPAASVAPPTARDGAGASDGRWLWALALALLGLEAWMRRAAHARQPAEVEHARVA